MKRLYVLLLSVFIISGCSKNNKPIFTENPEPERRGNRQTDTTVKEKKNPENPCIEFDKLNTKVRDGLIKQAEAQDKIRELIPKITEYYKTNDGKEFPEETWAFPVEGYGPGAIGGTNGSGYIQGGYNYFDGNKHTGHPAQDIFINDKNQDCLDDKTGKPVNVLSVSGGIVLAVSSSWEPDSDLRGGIYIWIYDPFTNKLFYYAHNKEIFVKPGDTVKPGDLIALVGRTGKNAYPKRSPTHLHLNYYSLKDGFPVPENSYDFLLKAKRF